MSEQPPFAVTHPDPHELRAAFIRVLANALLVLPAYGVAIVAVGVARGIVLGGPSGPIEAWLLFPIFLLVRWLYVLPGLLGVLVGIELVARHAPHARVLTAIVASGPMVWWALTQSSAGADISTDLATLGLTAVLFAVVARLPTRSRGRPTPPPPTPAAATS